MEALIPSEYRIVDEYWGNLFIRCTHYENNTWAIYNGEKYFKDHRFSSPEEALAFYTANKKEIQKGHHTHPEFLQ